MAVYRERRRTPAWLVGAVAVALVLAAAGGVAWAVASGQPSAEERIGEAVRGISAQVDVLTISHYTDDSVRDGRAALEGEYQAALLDVERAREAWDGVRDAVPPDDALRVDESLRLLTDLVRAKRAPEEVARAARDLLASLSALEGVDP